MSGQAFTIEVKLDGERMLAHVGSKGDLDHSQKSIDFYTRNCKDYSDTYAVMAPHVRECLRYPEMDCILDGEMLAWDNELKSVIDFGENRTVAKKETEILSQAVPGPLKQWLKYIVFDIVYLSGPGAAELIAKHVTERVLSITPVAPQFAPGDITSLPLAIRKSILKDMLLLKANRL